MKAIIKVIERENRTPVLISQLVEVWERSVRESHLFLSDGEILQIKEYVPQALYGVSHLLVAESEDGCLTGFMGIEGGATGNAVSGSRRAWPGSRQSLPAKSPRRLRRARSDGQRAKPAGCRILRAHGIQDI